MKSLVSIVLVCMLGLGAIYAQTDGFSVVTTESARRLSVASHPRQLPDALLQMASGGQDTLLHALRSDGRITVVNFIYTRCLSICLAMGSEYQQMQAALRAKGLTGRIRLLSISFDPADTPGQLERYAQGMHADPGIWQFAAVPQAAQRRALLDAFGIVVVPAPLGQFVHNAAYHIVTADGRLARIIDYSEPHSVLDFAADQARRKSEFIPGAGHS